MKDLRSYPSLNRAFAFFCFSAVPALGSAVSVVWHGGALVCLYEILSGRRKLSRDHAMLVMTLLLFVYCLANVVSTLWNSPTYGGIDKMLRLFTLLLFPFSYSIASISDRTTIARSVVLASMVACYTALAVSFVQFHFLGLRAAGGAGNAIVFAFAISLACSTSLAGLLSQQDSKLTLPLAGAVLAGWLALFYSGTRFLWLTTLPVNLLVLFIFRHQLRRFLTPRILLLVLVGMIIAVAAASQMIGGRLHQLAVDWNKLAQNQNYGTSLGARLFMLEMAVELIRQNPILGYGLGATNQLIEAGFREKHGLDISYSHFHNGYLTTMVEAGIVGLLSLLGIFFAATLNAVRTLRSTADPVNRLGAAMLIVLVATYGIGSLANKVLGHDIQDTLFIMFLIMGTYLASGTSMPSTAAGAAQQPV
ncbi:O-antigen ligase family protein [Mesorhizobium sp. KR2-14]|uniref:O-antigen ligase family protein n=1 Tax=Mesorhizobium sp. KR2-14 TaxID=3156610 RepID=UPI0032B3CF73